MGYCMNQLDVDFLIKNKNRKGALEAIKKLAKCVDERGGGGTWSNGKKIESNYAWVTTEEFVNAKTLEEAIQAWGWEGDADEKGDIIRLCFTGEKLGDDVIMLEAIAPFVEKGSYIEMQGEEGSIWRWVFDGKTMKEKTARIVYDMD